MFVRHHEHRPIASISAGAYKRALALTQRPIRSANTLKGVHP
jgi:hypothetical protein